MIASRFITIALIVLVALASRVGAADWGHLSGRFVFQGQPPAAQKMRITKDIKVFGDTVDDESLIVDAQNGGIANVVVYLVAKPNRELPIHPRYADDAKAQVELRMENGRFAPHILLLRTSQTLVQRNVDRVAHNTRITFLRNEPM